MDASCSSVVAAASKADHREHQWFKDALGQQGPAEFARLVDEGRATDDPDSWAVTWGVRDLREQLAAVSGDVDAHVARRRRRCSKP